MDQTTRDKLSKLVEELTTSGEPQLNKDKMKEVKKICRISNNYIDHFYHLIMTQLNQEHAEIRFSAFQMASELFSRSHNFRVLLITNLQEFLELTVETDAKQPLPPPKETARKLKTLAIQTMQSWHATYGEAYKKLSLGYHFLKQNKKVDFHDIEARSLAERKRQEDKQNRLKRIYKEKFEKAKREMEEMTADIEETSSEMNNCIKLLMLDDLTLFNEESSTGNSLSEAEDTSVQPCCSKDLIHEQSGVTTHKKEKEEKDECGDDSEVEEESDEDAFLRSTGLISHKYHLELSIATDFNVRETEENEALVNTVRDLYRLITTRHLPMVQSWIQVFTKVGVEEEMMRRATELKKSLEKVLRKHEQLHIDYKNRERRVMQTVEEGEEDDDDFEEVPEKEGYELHIPDHLRAEYGLKEVSSTSLVKSSSQIKVSEPVVKSPAPTESFNCSRQKKRMHDKEEDPTCAATTVLKQRLYLTPSTSVSGGPAEPMEGSSNQWDRNKGYKSQHQFWVTQEVKEEDDNKQLSGSITFTGNFEPVDHKCRALMTNGSLCERQDRVKCPFHGHIIPRDELGRPINPEDALRLEKEKRKCQELQPDWQDPELMREIEAVTGEDLGSSKTYGKGKGSKGKSKKKYPNLTDLKQNTNTSRSRLEKKVFNKSSMRRVTEVMNKMDKRKHEKFSNQFNYALN